MAVIDGGPVRFTLHSRSISANSYWCSVASCTSAATSPTISPTIRKKYWDRKLANAYDLLNYADAKRALNQLHRELMHVNPSAARSLEEGLDETLNSPPRSSS
jgi:hypothetical protein